MTRMTLGAFGRRRLLARSLAVRPRRDGANRTTRQEHAASKGSRPEGAWFAQPRATPWGHGLRMLVRANGPTILSGGSVEPRVGVRRIRFAAVSRAAWPVPPGGYLECRRDFAGSRRRSSRGDERRPVVDRRTGVSVLRLVPTPLPPARTAPWGSRRSWRPGRTRPGPRRRPLRRWRPARRTAAAASPPAGRR